MSYLDFVDTILAYVGPTMMLLSMVGCVLLAVAMLIATLRDILSE